MNIEITKGARQYGYIIWNGKKGSDIQSLLGDREKVNVVLNGFNIGEKAVDWKYHRISIGYKFTRALPDTVTQYRLSMRGDTLEVRTIDGE